MPDLSAAQLAIATRVEYDRHTPIYPQPNGTSRTDLNKNWVPSEDVRRLGDALHLDMACRAFHVAGRTAPNVYDNIILHTSSALILRDPVRPRGRLAIYLGDKNWVYVSIAHAEMVCVYSSKTGVIGYGCGNTCTIRVGDKQGGAQ